MLRSAKAYFLHALGFVTGGCSLAVPVYFCVSGERLLVSVLVVLSVSLLLVPLVMLHNRVFDVFEWVRFKRLASDRSMGLRIIHAVSMEMWSVLVSVAAISLITDLRFPHALMADVVLSHVFVVYGFLFHMLIDHLWPVSTVDVRERKVRKVIRRNGLGDAGA